MTTPDADRLEVWRTFLLGHAVIARMLTRALHEYRELPLTWFEILETLQVSGGQLRAMDLAERVMVHPSSLSRQIDGLEEAGFVIREKLNDDDNRAVMVRITKDGREIWRGASTVYHRIVKRAFTNQLTETDVVTLHRIFTKILDAQ
ncbi:MAG: MarR family winged helix-turn-helix transcriptional regulator [Ilumatobacteraceae bacterium]